MGFWCISLLGVFWDAEFESVVKNYLSMTGETFSIQKHVFFSKSGIMSKINQTKPIFNTKFEISESNYLKNDYAHDKKRTISKL